MLGESSHSAARCFRTLSCIAVDGVLCSVGGAVVVVATVGSSSRKCATVAVSHGSSGVLEIAGKGFRPTLALHAFSNANRFFNSHQTDVASSSPCSPGEAKPERCASVALVNARSEYPPSRTDTILPSAYWFANSTTS